MSHQHIARRNVLAAGAATMGAVAATSCSGNDAPEPKPNATLAALDDIPVGQSTTAKTPEGEDVIVTRSAEDAAKVFSATCTHQGCTVQPQKNVLRCPCHGSEFDPATGAVRKGPAEEPLPSVPVRVEGGKVITNAAKQG